MRTKKSASFILGKAFLLPIVSLIILQNMQVYLDDLQGLYADQVPFLFWLRFALAPQREAPL
jgi:hypothetical protein